MIGGGEEERELRKERRWEKGQEERRRRGMNVGQLQQLPVSHQSWGGRRIKWVGGKSVSAWEDFPISQDSQWSFVNWSYTKKQAYERRSGNRVRLTC